MDGQRGEAEGRSLGMQVEDAGQRAGLAARLLTCPCCRGRAGSLPARCLSFSSARRGVTGGVPAPCFGETNKSEKYPLSPVLMQPPPPLPRKGVQLPACLSPRILSLTLSRELRIPFGYPTAPFHGLGATFHPLGAPGKEGAVPVVLPTLCRGETEPGSSVDIARVLPEVLRPPARQWLRARPPLAGPPGSGLPVPRGAAGAGRHGALLLPLHPFDVRAAQVPSAPKSRHRLRHRNRPATAVLRPSLTPYPCPRPARGEGTLLPTPPRPLAISLCSRGAPCGTRTR